MNNFVNSSFTTAEAIEIHCSDRWSVYHRLQDLGISCHCDAYQPLWARVAGASTAAQVWSVVFCMCGQHDRQRQWLEQCLMLDVDTQQSPHA